MLISGTNSGNPIDSKNRNVGLPVVHLKKLCVGVDSVAQLRAYQQKRASLYHDTRHFPKRAAEILAGGSLYWIIRGHFSVRQIVVDLQKCSDEERGIFCRIVYARDLIEVRADKHHPFQGWRYLELDKAPPDTHIGSKGEALPASLAATLDRLGVPASVSR